LICTNNLLATLDISNNSTLVNITCNNNQLITLDLTQNNNLGYLNCANNLLTSLNVKNGNNTNFSFFNSTNNPNLTCIYVDNAIYSNTSWSNIDSTSTFVETTADCNALAISDYYNDFALHIYPNPTKNNFKIESDLAISKINIYDNLGKLLLQFNTQETYDVSSLTDGVYFIQIYSNNKKTQQKLIIK